jgi:hypothetical protein
MPPVTYFHYPWGKFEAGPFVPPHIILQSNARVSLVNPREGNNSVQVEQIILQPNVRISLVHPRKENTR